MHHYANYNGNAGVTAYHIGSNYIDVQFQDGSIYRYTYSSAGKTYIEEMKGLAASGKGLTTFINRYVKSSYAAKLN